MLLSIKKLALAGLVIGITTLSTAAYADSIGDTIVAKVCANPSANSTLVLDENLLNDGVGETGQMTTPYYYWAKVSVDSTAKKGIGMCTTTNQGEIKKFFIQFQQIGENKFTFSPTNM